MKRKHLTPIGVDDRMKRKKIKTKVIPVAAKTKDVPLSAVFQRLLNSITNKTSASRFHPQVTASNPTNKRVNNENSKLSQRSGIPKAISMSTTKSSSSQVTYKRQQTQNTGLANTENRVLPIFSGITETPKHDNEFSNDHAENEEFQDTVDTKFEDTMISYRDLEFECSSQDVSDTDTLDAEQTIEVDTEIDNQSERVSFMAALFKKTFAVQKTKVKPVSPKEDG
ncbi:hypothetical protein Bca4012_029939 [Brassica carinata]|uniref:Uncharacterized protein n=1 Tax=Brassica napus TaxID=3708 RepID=A0ABQ7ZTI1_BRANA|nr:hypothetical protein HID58_059534 [Brassica napus]